MKKLVLALSLLTSTHAFATPEVYTIDPSHSFANFSIRHVVAKTSGTFNNVTGEISIDPSNLATAKVTATIDVNSVDTGLDKRNEHIKADKYLDVIKFPTITFESTKVVPGSRGSALLVGNLSMHGVTKQVNIPVKVLGFGQDPWGGTRAGFEGKTTIKASDFGYGWATGATSPVGDELEITLLIEGIQKK